MESIKCHLSRSKKSGLFGPSPLRCPDDLPVAQGFNFSVAHANGSQDLQSVVTDGRAAGVPYFSGFPSKLGGHIGYFDAAQAFVRQLDDGTAGHA